LIPSLREILHGVFGAWRLARLDHTAMVHFDRSVEGFWKSFFAAAIVAPAYLILVVTDLVGRESEATLLRLFIVHLAAFSLGWTVYPVVAAPICQAIDRGNAYIGFIIAFNWIKVIQMAVYLPVIAIDATGVLPTGLNALLHVLVYSLVLAYQWFVTRVALTITPMAAAGFVALDLVIAIVIAGFADGMTR
jgi:hypothetical protein